MSSSAAVTVAPVSPVLRLADAFRLVSGVTAMARAAVVCRFAVGVNTVACRPHHYYPRSLAGVRCPPGLVVGGLPTQSLSRAVLVPPLCPDVSWTGSERGQGYHRSWLECQSKTSHFHRAGGVSLAVRIVSVEIWVFLSGVAMPSACLKSSFETSEAYAPAQCKA